MFDGFYSKITKAPEFPVGFDWINSDEPLSLERLRGHIVVLDFWTYCCINCMHTLPVLASLEEKYEGRPVVFVGVHSAKFFNEEDKRNIEQAVKRYEIAHPVLVDRKMITWQRYEVAGWPTIVIIDPKGTVVYKQSGEGQKEMIEDTIDVLLEKHATMGTLTAEPIKISRRVMKDSTVLSFPGKIAIFEGMIAISDSNHNRIVITDMSGKTLYEIGSGRRGFADGDFDSATFFRPQGVCWKGKTLFVADTENHAIRKIDLPSRKVSTVAGTGRQGPWMSKGGKGLETSISSPWDVAVKDNLVFIAMAGNHQIWSLDVETGLVKPFAGNGHEDIVDGARSSARLAQPSGLAVLGDKLYFTDSETSSIREIDLVSGFVRTLAGHGLFVFGHKDGSLEEALFQHPLGLAATQDHVYVADTYNSAIRVIDLKKATTSTLIGYEGMKGTCNLGEPGCDTLGLYEPGDVKIYQSRLYIADTNNHLVRVYDLETNRLTTLEIRS
ncbi:MAG TPA: thioredoxin-like domain-containing protein [Candidatus Nitrosotalea sp.]|nr:thioredoxin-like domain-containing protein [Candidatus Nitrosotalea sp.]